MKKSTLTLTRITTSFLLSASLILGSTPASALSITEQSDDSSFVTLNRVYDTESNGLLHYHFEDEEGNTVELNHSDNTTSTQNAASLKKASNLPSSYDLRTVNAISTIKDQGVTGCCWAFAAIKAMESNLAMKGVDSIDNLDLSENHLSWYTYHPSTVESDPLYEEGISYTTPFFGTSDEYNEGGNASLAAFTLARWSGAVDEIVAPFTGNSTAEIADMVSAMKKNNETLRYLSDYILTDSVCYDNATRDQIKEVLMTDGAIDLSYYHSQEFFNDDTNAYYQEHLRGKLAVNSANHSVNIIGWDDDYPKENFSPYKPESDGAWLIANSYGDAFGENGFSWISYEEPSLTEFYTYCADSADTYDNNYQYDGFGWSSSVADGSADSTTGANIYTANKDYNQELTAVGLYTLTDGQSYTIKIYRGVTAGNPVSGTLAATISGTKEFAGYHTIPLEKSVSLKGGERFSVVVSYDRTNSNSGYIPVEGYSERDFSCEITYHSNAGESFLYDSSDAEWVDTSVQQSRDQLRNNVCIKAFTKNTTVADNTSDDSDDNNSGNNSNDDNTNHSQDDTNGDDTRKNEDSTGDSSEDDETNHGHNEIPSTIKFVKSNITLGVGENYSPILMLSNAVNLTISYESSDASIATVGNTGKITAKSVGTAKIVATLSSGTSTTLTVKVKEAPTKITVKPSKKKTIAKKKSFRIKVSLPAGSASNQITYSSSKPSVAKVSAKGKVTGKKKGKAVITVKTYNGVTAKITIKVK